MKLLMIWLAALAVTGASDPPAVSPAPGGVIAWIDGGGGRHVKAFGIANLSTLVPVDRRTIFHMASVTKPFVAAAVMQLAERGRIDLDAPLSRYLPYLHIDDPRADGVTIRRMLNHSSGLPDIDDYAWGKGPADDNVLERWVRQLAGIKLVSSPGVEYHYSNLAYDLFGDVIAKASGMPFEEYMHRHIFAPLGMRDSSLLLAKVDRRRLAAPHMIEDGRVVVYPVFPYNRVHAGSSTLYSDASDMLRWARFWAQPLNGRLLSSTSMEAMLRPTIAVDRPDRRQWSPGVGLGWSLLVVKGHRIAYHMGQDIGFTTSIMIEPGTGRAVIAMTNIATEAESNRLFDACLRRLMALDASAIQSWETI